MKIRFDRLYKLYHHLKYGELGHEKFDFALLNAFDNITYCNTKIKNCGSNGCAMGELPIMDPKNWEFDNYCTPRLIDSNSGNFECDVNDYFGINYSMRQHLFYPNEQVPYIYGGKNLCAKATKEEVADNILAFIDVKAKEYNGSATSRQ